VLWVNKVIFGDHPIKAAASSWFFGYLRSAMKAISDKFATNSLLCCRGLPIAASILAAPAAPTER